MPHHIGEGLLHDTVRGLFGCGGRPAGAGIRPDVQLHVQSRAPRVLGELGQFTQPGTRCRAERRVIPEHAQQLADFVQ
ncbi:hypothetical protein ASF98_09310 [Arthrobacter sp. Leaf337]|nr:hypothetical protein ASF98_09310 [Arthrobacter sp. Leaf337]